MKINVSWGAGGEMEEGGQLSLSVSLGKQAMQKNTAIVLKDIYPNIGN